MEQIERLQREIRDLKLRVMELEADNRKSFRKLSSFKEESKALYIIIAEYNYYTLIYRPVKFEPWIVAYNYCLEQKCWDQGHYFDKFADAIKYLFANEPILQDVFGKENEDE